MKMFCKVLLWLLLLPTVGQAQFTWTANNGKITITKYTGSGGEVVIPDTITDLGSKRFSRGPMTPSRRIQNNIKHIMSPINNVDFKGTSIVNCSITRLLIKRNNFQVDHTIHRITSKAANLAQEETTIAFESPVNGFSNNILYEDTILETRSISFSAVPGCLGGRNAILSSVACGTQP